MLHIKIAENPDLEGHRNLYYYLSALGKIIITDSFYYQDFLEYSKLQNKEDHAYLEKLTVIIKMYFRYGIDMMKKVKENEYLFFPLEYYDECIQGMKISNHDENRFSIGYGFILEGGHMVVGEFSTTIRIFPASENDKFIQVRRPGYFDKRLIIESFSKAAENIKVVKNFDFLLSWK